MKKECYKIDEIIKIYDDYDEEGYPTDDSTLICSTVKISSDVILSKKEINNITNELLSKKFDYILLKKNGAVNPIHVTHSYNEQSIKDNGLHCGDGDFGYGLYVINKDNEIALDNLKTYIVDSFRNSEKTMAICNISYSGEYYECINQGTNEGYLLLTESDNIKLNSIDTVNIVDFLQC